jgi:hypothetical protein
MLFLPLSTMLGRLEDRIVRKETNSSGTSRSRTTRARLGSMSLSHVAITTVATQFPSRLVRQSLGS